ncbi:hypothetical protein STCU_08434 [Strigomonas culicis]|uniref:Uncharacterized protein n=1 Tax=Strigomonas culicis TaxID=28005 RepID=S9TU24_9TRYP|nr:hypothetical protein STCU_08434 [Strigomonas culicis]|eukprot:EPY21922.1 hypothetical protein STCU_08434 [Strigomonas culicis]
MRTFVFITNIPDVLLAPLEDSRNNNNNNTNSAANSKASRDPRYERLRRFLADHSSGVMLAMHLETRGYGLALYASEEEALDACRAEMALETPAAAPLRLRIIEKERPPPLEAVYQPHITVEGETVAKEALATTRGLELAYRGLAVPLWCPHTKDGEDCYYGMSCYKVHLKEHQRTVRKRPRTDALQHRMAFAQLSPTERATVTALERSLPQSIAALVPPHGALHLVPEVNVALTAEELAWLQAPAAAPPADLVGRVEAACAAGGLAAGAPRFLRLSCPGGAPWDWALQDPAGLARLRALCPLPANGAPTPLERDLLLQKLLYYLNQLNRFTSVAAGLAALRASAKVRRALAQHVEEAAGRRSAAQRHRAEAEGEGEEVVHLCVRPWLYLPTVGCEVTVFLEQGGAVLRGAVQRRGEVRLMASAAQLVAALAGPTSSAAPDGLEAAAPAVRQVLDRCAQLGREGGGDEDAPQQLEAELLRHDGLFGRAVQVLQRYITKETSRRQQHVTDLEVLPSQASWCLQLALAQPDPLRPAAAGRGEGGEGQRRVVVLSCQPYQRALEECSMYNYILRSSTAASEGDGSAGAKSGTHAAPVKVGWNTQHHPFVSLFERSVLESLRPEPETGV